MVGLRPRNSHNDLSDIGIEGLRTYFEQFGKVDACTIMRDPTGRSRCFAFLTFEEAASVNAVMVREHVLDGKIVRCVITVLLNVHTTYEPNH